MAEHKLRIDVKLGTKQAQQETKKLSDSFSGVKKEIKETVKSVNELNDKTGKKATWKVGDYTADDIKKAKKEVERLTKEINKLDEKAEKLKSGKRLSQYVEELKFNDEAYNSRMRDAGRGATLEQFHKAMETIDADHAKTEEVIRNKYAAELSELKEIQNTERNLVQQRSTLKARIALTKQAEEEHAKAVKETAKETDRSSKKQRVAASEAKKTATNQRAVTNEAKKTSRYQSKTSGETSRLGRLTKRIHSSWTGVRKTVQSVAKGAIAKLGSGIKNAAKWAGNIGSKIKQSVKPAENLRKKFLKIGLAMLGARSAFIMFKQVISEAMSNNEELQNQLQATKGVMGEALAPAIQLLVNALGKVVTFADRVYQLFTGTSLIAKYNAKQAQKQADATKDAAENAKEYQKQMASFDVANKLSDNTSSSSSASSGSSTDDSAIKFNEVDVDGWLEDILKKIKTKDWTGVGSTIAEKIVSGLNSIDWQGIQEKASGAAKGFAEMLNGLFEFTSEDGSTLMSSIGKTIGESLNTVVGTVLSFAENLHWGTLGSELSHGIVTALKTIDWYKLFDTATELGTGVAEWINGVFDFGQEQQNSLAMNLSKGISNALHSAFLAVNSFLGTMDWGKIGLSIAQFIQNINWVQLSSDLAETLSEAAKGVLETVIGYFEGMDWGKVVDDIFLSILAFVRKFDWSGIASDLARLLGDLFGAALRIAVTIIQDTIATIMNIGQMIKKYFDEHIQDAKDSGGSVAQGILTGIADIFSDIASWIVNNIFKPFIDGFKSAFGIHSPSKEMQPLGANIWNGVLEGIKNLVSLDKLKSWWQENVVAKVKNAWKTVVSVTAEIGGTIKDSFKDLKNKWDSIKNKTNKATADGTQSKNFKNMKDKWDAFKNKTKKATADGTQSKNFKNMKDKFDSVKNKTVEITAKLKDAITGALNTMIGKINDLIAKLRKISIAGYKPFKDIKDIPKLARGGIVNNPGRGVQATIGEAGREAVLPLDKNTGWMDMLAERLAQRVNGSGQMVQTIITLDGETIAKKVVEVNNRKRVRLNGGLV